MKTCQNKRKNLTNDFTLGVKATHSSRRGRERNNVSDVTQTNCFLHLNHDFDDWLSQPYDGSCSDMPMHSNKQCSLHPRAKLWSRMGNIINWSGEQITGSKRYIRLTHKGIIAGKLKGQIPAQTPSGSRMLNVSIPFDTLERYSPICRDAIPQACSTTSTGGKQKQ